MCPTGMLICGTKVWKAVTIAYAPPVAEQIAALPAEAILVRGSAQPVAALDGLLRAAALPSETAPDELLRPVASITE